MNNAPDPSWTTWCEVSASALRSNIGRLRARLGPGVRLGAVVKSDAYGHGLAQAAPVFVAAGADLLIVNTVPEATAVRAIAGLGTVPLYICGPVLPEQAPLVAHARASVVVSRREMVDALAAAGRAQGHVIGLHIKVETGTHRQGVNPADVRALADRIASTAGVALEGMATHYADIEDTTEHAFARGQLERFQASVAAVRAAGHTVPIVHSANSAATILYPETHGDQVRAGIAAYGLWPSTETRATALQIHAQGGEGIVPDLRPALSWRARITEVKTVPAGAFISYGRTFRATHFMRIAVVPVGYFEGYDRRLSGAGHMLVDGVRAPVRGRVCMNMTLVEVTDIPNAEPGSVVTLLGSDGDECVSADQLAQWMGSINYEVVARVGASVPRICVD